MSPHPRSPVRGDGPGAVGVRWSNKRAPVLNRVLLGQLSNHNRAANVLIIAQLIVHLGVPHLLMNVTRLEKKGLP